MEFIDLKAQQQQILLKGGSLREDIDQRIKAVLDHGKYILGAEVSELENKLAKFVGAKYCIGVSSGTDALFVSLLALNIGPGSKVFLPAFTYTATAEVIALLKATPVFVDVDDSTYNISPSDLDLKITLWRSCHR